MKSFNNNTFTAGANVILICFIIRKLFEYNSPIKLTLLMLHLLSTCGIFHSEIMADNTLNFVFC